jgi:hypothetical protein
MLWKPISGDVSMTTEEMLAREALILSLLRGYPSLASSITRGTIDSYVSAVDGYSVSALRNACDRYGTGDVEGYDRRWPPNAAELATLARMYDTIEKRSFEPAPKLVSYPIGGQPPAGHVPLGPDEVNFGHGRINMRGLDHRTKEFVLRHKRLPEPEETKQIGVVPKLQRMAAP